MLSKKIQDSLINKMAANGEKFTPMQSSYINSIMRISDGTLQTLCRESNTLNTDKTDQYDFLFVVRMMFQNFVVNQYINDNVIYPNHCEAWIAFRDELPQVPENKIVRVDYINYASEIELTKLFTVTFSLFDIDSTEADQISDVLDNKNQFFAFQLTEQERLKILTNTFTFKCGLFEEIENAKALDQSYASPYGQMAYA